MLTELQTKQLERLKHYHTRYELVATNGDRRVLAGYTSSKNRSGAVSMLRQHGEAWQAFTGHKLMTFGKKSSDGVILGDWRINFSGRTQRDAILGGELPFILDVVKKVQS